MNVVLDKMKDLVADKVAETPKPTASIKFVTLKEVDSDGVSYMVGVAVNNPYLVPIPICDIDYTFKSASRVIVSGKIPDRGSLKGNETTMLDVHMKVPHTILLSLVKDIVEDWDIDYEVNIKLIIDLPLLGHFTFPVNYKGEMKLPTWREMFISK